VSGDAEPAPSAPTTAPAVTPATAEASDAVAYPEGDLVLTLPEGVDPFADTVVLPAVKVSAGNRSSD
jgi:hypothetical protein